MKKKTELYTQPTEQTYKLDRVIPETDYDCISEVWLTPTQLLKLEELCELLHTDKDNILNYATAKYLLKVGAFKEEYKKKEMTNRILEVEKNMTQQQKK